MTTQKLANASVTSLKLANSAVTNAKLADNSVSAVKIQNKAVITDKLADYSVTAGKLHDGAVSREKLADMAVNEDKLSPEINDKIYEAISASEKLRNDVFGENYNKNNISVRENFSLSFVCTFLSSGYPQTGTWTCRNTDALYDNIIIDGHFLEHHSAAGSPLDITSISVTDNYLENDSYEICIHINLDKNNTDGYPAGSVYHVSSEEVVDYNAKYPYIKSENENEIILCLGYITLPDTNIVLNGSELIMNVSSGGLLRGLITKDKNSILDAVNENSSRISDTVYSLQNETINRRNADERINSNVQRIDSDLGDIITDIFHIREFIDEIKKEYIDAVKNDITLAKKGTIETEIGMESIRKGEYYKFSQKENEVFILKNDLIDEIADDEDYLRYNDECGWKVTEKLKHGRAYKVKMIKHPVSGADYEDGLIEVLYEFANIKDDKPLYSIFSDVNRLVNMLYDTLFRHEAYMKQYFNNELSAYKSYTEKILGDMSQSITALYDYLGAEIYDGGLFGTNQEGRSIDGGLFEEEQNGRNIDCGEF